MTQAEASGRVSEALGRVESQLAELWRPAEGEAPKVRASTMNLVAVAGSDVPDDVIATIEALSATHPARALALSVDPRLPPWALEPDVQAICRKDPGGEVICSERVLLAFGAVTVKRAASVIASLAIPELPTVVWALPPASQLIVDALVPIADRWIVDTRRTSIARVLPLARSARGYLADLGWIEMFPWRDLTARFFDDPGVLPLARTVSRLEVRHAARSDGKTPDDVRLYVGWLASRLGWTLTGPTSAEGASGPIDLHVSAEPASPRGAGTILGAALFGQVSGREACARVSREPGEGGFHWTTACGGDPLREHRHRLTTRDDLWLLTHAIDGTEPDRILREAVVSASTWRA